MSNAFEGIMMALDILREAGLNLAITANQIRVECKKFESDAKMFSEIAKMAKNGEDAIDYIEANITHTEDMGVRPEETRSLYFGAFFDTMRWGSSYSY